MRSPISRNFLTIPSPLSAHPPSFTSGGRPLLLLDGKGNDPSAPRSPSLLKGLSADSLRRREETDDGWTLIRSHPQSQNITNAILSSFAESDVHSPSLTDKSQRSPDWKDGDFPPLDAGLKRMTLREEGLEENLLNR